jgi:hypothetical protein
VTPKDMENLVRYPGFLHSTNVSQRAAECIEGASEECAYASIPVHWDLRGPVELLSRALSYRLDSVEN